MDCESCRLIMTEYIDDCCGEAEKAALLEHARACDICNNDLQLMKSARGACLELAEEYELPTGFHSSLMKKLKTANTPSILAGARRMPLVAAAVFLFVAIGLFASLYIQRFENNKAINQASPMMVADSGAADTEQRVFPESFLVGGENYDMGPNGGVFDDDGAMGAEEGAACADAGVAGADAGAGAYQTDGGTLAMASAAAPVFGLEFAEEDNSHFFDYNIETGPSANLDEGGIAGADASAGAGTGGEGASSSSNVSSNGAPATNDGRAGTSGNSGAGGQNLPAADTAGARDETMGISGNDEMEGLAAVAGDGSTDNIARAQAEAVVSDDEAGAGGVGGELAPGPGSWAFAEANADMDSGDGSGYGPSADDARQHTAYEAPLMAPDEQAWGPAEMAPEDADISIRTSPAQPAGGNNQTAGQQDATGSGFMPAPSSPPATTVSPPSPVTTAAPPPHAPSMGTEQEEQRAPSISDDSSASGGTSGGAGYATVLHGSIQNTNKGVSYFDDILSGVAKTYGTTSIKTPRGATGNSVSGVRWEITVLNKDLYNAAAAIEQALKNDSVSVTLRRQSGTGNINSDSAYSIIIIGG